MLFISLSFLLFEVNLSEFLGVFCYVKEFVVKRNSFSLYAKHFIHCNIAHNNRPVPSLFFLGGQLILPLHGIQIKKKKRTCFILLEVLKKTSSPVKVKRKAQSCCCHPLIHHVITCYLQSLPTEKFPIPGWKRWCCEAGELEELQEKFFLCLVCIK